MIKAGQKKRDFFAPFLAAFCAVVLLVSQVSATLGHDEHSHEDAFGSVCDYCIVEKINADLDTFTTIVDVDYYVAEQLVLSQPVSSPYSETKLFRPSRAPPSNETLNHIL